MPSATASGAKATPNGGGATSRDHKQGNQERKFTPEQRAAVVRVRRCSPVAFYDILGLEEVRLTVTENEIKKAYRKLSLLTHPDKNGSEGADEAFKMVSRAFQVLSDPDKKVKFDSHGGDPDNRFGPGSAAAAAASSPFSGFARSPGSARQAPMWDDEISPEELFARFFGGGGMGGGGPFGAYNGGMFDTGPQFVFNLGGGPGFRVHQFAGARPRRRPRDATTGEDVDEPSPSFLSALSNLLPLLILFVLPFLSSLFSGDGLSSGSSGPSFRFDSAVPPHTLHRQTPRLNIDYYVNPSDVVDWPSRKLHQLDQKAELSYLGRLRSECDAEFDRRQRLMQDARGWIFQDLDKLHEARNMPMTSCDKLDRLRSGRPASQ